MAWNNSDRGKRWLGVIIVLFIVAVLGLELYDLAVRRASSRRSMTRSRVQEGSLELRADLSGTHWKVAWNPNSAPFKSASKAELIIDDGPQHIVQSLSPAQILSGGTMYSPRTDDVVFRLQVFDTGDSLTSGTVRLVRFGRAAEPSAVETCEEVVKVPHKAPSSAGHNQAARSVRSRADELEASPGPASMLKSDSQAVTVSNADREPASVAQTPIVLGSVETAEPAVAHHRPIVREAPANVQAPVADWSDKSFDSPRKSKNVFRVFAKVGRKVGRLFWHSKQTPSEPAPQN